MKITLNFGSESEVETIIADSKVVGVVIHPRFTKRTGQAIIGAGLSTSDGGKELERFELLVSGNTGKLTKTNCVEAVKAAVDDDDAPKRGNSE